MAQYPSLEQRHPLNLTPGVPQVFNIGQLLLVGGWLAWLPYPNCGNINGPVWFIVALVWIWLLYPWLSRPVRQAFQRDSGGAFAAKIVVLWLFSCAPWAALLALHGQEQALGYRNYDELMWAFKPFPLFRLAEFIIGMALALRAWEAAEAGAPSRAAYAEIDGAEEGGGPAEWGRPGVPPLALAAVALAAVAAYVAAGTAGFAPACRCLDVAG